MKIARYTSMSDSGHSYESIQTEKEGEQMEKICGYVRLTEFVEVEFPPLKDEAIVEKQLAVIDNAEAELRTKFQQALNGLDRKRAELRAITYVPAQRTDGSVDEYLQ